MASLDSEFSAAVKELVIPVGFVPNSSTALSTQDTWVYQMTIANVTDSDATLTVQNTAGTQFLFSGTTIPARNSFVAAWPEGEKLSAGVKWLAGTANAIQASFKAKVQAG